MKIGIILGSTREQRVSEQVGKWVLDQSNLYGSTTYEIVDIRDFELPFLGTSADMTGIKKWNSKLNEFDGFVFILAEYNHSMPASLKNALDLAREPWHNKAAGIISYGSAGGARATEHLRGVLGELQVADIRTHILLSLFTDFENGSTFKPMDIHKSNLEIFFPQLESWSKALKTIR
ncbi:NAD(P)H-dependent oxidoreductase [Mycoplasmatota bacterium]|nr:NAD(P)H-dependent oxidoreductase [Mycoplasmatota bacterium]